LDIKNQEAYYWEDDNQGRGGGSSAGYASSLDWYESKLNLSTIMFIH